ncbi:MAG: hypothetical protein PHQ52_08355 [Candidatus Omnitrophica bacterium]|nr:hypothetical protein [Candidatus Omnitrophota bacterium]
MKKYIQPKIKLIELDSAQAIIQVCSVGGNYMRAGGIQCGGEIGETSVYSFQCTISVRGRLSGSLDFKSSHNSPS